MSFNGTEGAAININDAAALTANHRRTNPATTNAHFVGRDLIEQILAQSDCQGLRIYYGLDEKGERELVIVGADSNENDQLGLIVDRCAKCPPRCGNQNRLNS